MDVDFELMHEVLRKFRSRDKRMDRVWRQHLEIDLTCSVVSDGHLLLADQNDQIATVGCLLMSLFASRGSLVEIHAVTSSLFVLDHLEIVRRQTKRLQYTITELSPVSALPEFGWVQH